MLKVLIADDDNISRTILAKRIAEWGYETLTAQDGNQALEVFQNNNIAIAILDWMMPGLSGLELCKNIRKANLEHYTYIILLTSKDSQKDINKGLEAGADDYITKPFNPPELRARLKTGSRIIELQAQLHEQAIHDDLTGLLNRAEILRILEEEYERAFREDRILGVMMLDIDYFKKVNDAHGHPIGDAVLQETAGRLQTCLRSYDKMGRYGGEEFIIIIANTSELKMKSISERLRKKIEDEAFTTAAGELEITISIGYITTKFSKVRSESDLIKLSDDALYQAKDSGRNCVKTIKE